MTRKKKNDDVISPPPPKDDPIVGNDPPAAPTIAPHSGVTATVQEETRDLRNQQAQHTLDVSQWRIDQRNSGKSMAEVNEMERRGEGPR